VSKEVEDGVGHECDVLSLDDVKYAFTGANFVLTNKETGKTFFEMKRKTPTEDECYYLFKFYDEDMPDEDTKAKVHRLFEGFMCPLAATMGIGMFSFDEVSERTTERVKEILRHGEQLPEEQIDISIEIFDHASKELGELVVGVSAKPV